MKSSHTFTEVWEGLSPADKRGLAERLDCSKDYLSQLAHGYRTPSTWFASALCRDLGKSKLFPSTGYKKKHVA